MWNYYIPWWILCTFLRTTIQLHIYRAFFFHILSILYFLFRLAFLSFFIFLYLLFLCLCTKTPRENVSYDNIYNAINLIMISEYQELEYIKMRISLSCSRRGIGGWRCRTWWGSRWWAWTWHLMWWREARAAGVYLPIGRHGDGHMAWEEIQMTTCTTCTLCATTTGTCTEATTQVCMISTMNSKVIL